MGRVDSILGPLGIVILAGIILLGVVRVLGARGRGSGQADDPDGLSDAGEDVARDAGPPQFRDFAEALDDYVAPLHARHPDWDRLDGAVGLPGRAAFRFERDGIRFEVNGETRFAPLLAARDWMAAHPGEDPLEVQREGRIGRLRLRREIWPDPRDVRIQTN